MKIGQFKMIPIRCRLTPLVCCAWQIHTTRAVMLMVLIATVSFIRYGSLLFSLRQQCAMQFTIECGIQPSIIDIIVIAIIVIIIVIIAVNIVHASCYKHANKSVASHNNLSNNEIIYLKCNWALWCSRTFETRTTALQLNQMFTG